MLVRDTHGQLAKFMGYFQGNLAKAVNKERCRHGKFWSREYDDVLLDDTDEAFFDRYAYVLANAVKAGLVDSAHSWTGVSSLKNALSGDIISVDVLNRTRLHNATRRNKNVDITRFIETHTITITPPPIWAGLAQDVRAAHLKELIVAADDHFRALRDHKAPLGMDNVLRQRPFDAPQATSFRPRIKVFATSKERRKILLDAYRSHVGAYRNVFGDFIKAAALGRRPAVEWPMWSYPPACARPIGFNIAS
jgi:hypothetical protein